MKQLELLATTRDIYVCVLLASLSVWDVDTGRQVWINDEDLEQLDCLLLGVVVFVAVLIKI